MANPLTLKVELGNRGYPVVIGARLLGEGFDLAAFVSGPDCLVVSNETVAPIYLDPLRRMLAGKNLRTVNLRDGEAYKTLASVGTVIDELVSAGANRDVTLIALGGGVVGDITGFAAACYMRGVAFIQVPTTLLAQVDSSVGGKTGVNHAGGKNLIGAFHQPKLVLIDTDTLVTLPAREFSAGMAEVIKHAAILDREYFAWLEKNIGRLMHRDRELLAQAILRSCEIKAAVVAADEREQGRRALLNFGHTFGHAIENCSGYGKWLHGEAVAAGMMMAADLGGLAATERDRLRALIAAAGLPVAPPAVGAGALRAAMELDKKVQQKKLRFVMLRAIGDAYVGVPDEPGRLDSVLETANS
ncbi:MAG: 3-dehydroquinate synthase [Woeseiaceae bacterium]|nr:3-dehydroquinate synthase [Woeseiaceae bacterium]